MGSRETQARDEVPAVVRRRPGTAGTYSSSDRQRSSLEYVPAACALGAQASPLPLFIHGWGDRPPLSVEVRRNRRAPGASAGGKHGDDGRLRPELTCFSTAGDRQIADCSAVNSRYRRMKLATTSLRPSRLCGSKPGCVGCIGSPSEQGDAILVTAMICVICVYLRYLRLTAMVPL
jgi:hypothetical protein